MRLVIPCVLVAVGVGAGTALAGRQGALPLPSLPSPADLLRGPRFQLRSIDLIGLRRVEAADLLARISVGAGVPLIDVDVERIAREVEQHPRVARCRAVRVPPNRLLLQISERRPAALLGAGEAIDLHGERFRLAAEEVGPLPRLRGEAAAALPLLAAAAERSLELRRVEAARAGDVRFQPAEGEVWVRVGSDPGRALDDWVRIATSGLVQRYGAGEVDLRFRDSVVLRASATGGGRDGQTR